jgi:hypothetical protein
LLAHPEVAYRSCEDCKRWVYVDQTGKQQKDRKGHALQRVGRTPCDRCAKCADSPVKSPEAGAKRSLSAVDWRTIQLYYEYQNEPVQDAILRRHFGRIRQFLDQYDRDQRRAFNSMLPMLIGRPR